jgi:hypothetical protein
MTQNQKSQKTERIKQRLEQLKAAARPAAEPEEIEIADNVPLTESDAAPVKSAAAKDVNEEFTLDGAAKFVISVDGERLVGQYRINDATITISDPVTGYTSSVPIVLAFVRMPGIGRLVDVEKSNINIPRSFKLRNGELVVSMAFPLPLSRVVWRVASRSVVWAVVQYQPTKSEWRITRLRSTPKQTIYEAGEIMRNLLGDSIYTKLKEAVELLSTPL